MRNLKKPVVQLQNSINESEYNPNAKIYDTILRYLVYTHESEQILLNEKKFKKYQLHYVKPDNNCNFNINELYFYFKNLQENKITFIGYNFYGIGGTVNATMALAESLLEKGYFVDTISLKKTNYANNNPPYGLNMKYLTWDDTSSLKERFDRFTHRSGEYYHYLNLDNGKKYVHPYVGYALDELMKNIKSRTVVSTREPLHLFLNSCSSENVKNRIYVFHALSDIMNDIYPDLMDELNKIKLEKAVFITDRNRLAIKEKYNYDNYEKHIVLGNSLSESKILNRDEIKPVCKKSKYNAIYLLRISYDRAKDIENLIEFGKYIKKNDIKYIELDVFGGGDYVFRLKELIKINNLEDIIHYNPPTKDAISQIRQHDFMIDFSLTQSFGMTYIEGVLNGKKVFCMKNLGSLEVMEDIPNSYIESFEWLCSQINEIHKISINELKSNYDKIKEKYSQKIIADKFIDLLE